MSRACALVFSLFLALQVQAAALLASVDRTRLNAGETLELTLETQDVTQFGKPDLSPLEANFEVRGTRQVNSLNSLDEKNANTRWIVTLLPRQSGSIEIPALQLGEVRSQPISLQIQANQVSSENHGPVFIDASLDQPEIYVQAQAVLTVSIYHSVPLYDDSSLSPLQLDNAKVEPLGETRTFEKLIDGVRHGVIEMRYAIYPQQSGDLKIPTLTFSATAAQNDAEQELNTPRAGKQVQVSSTPLVLTVDPIPADYPANAAWLPANSLTLEEHWSPDPAQQQTQIGDSLTRTLILQAEGLSSAQLPPLPGTEVTGLRRYPDQPQLRNQVNDRGLLGVREEREALVPTHAGKLELPSQEVVWWNTREDHLERSNLPARSLQIEDNPALSADKPASVDPVTVQSYLLWPWQLSTLVLALTTLLGFALWWRARSQPAVLRAAQTGPSPRTLLDDLKRACQANDPQATRQALDAWARQQPETLAEMAARFVPLSDALDGLNGALYSESGQYWQGEELWRAIGTIPAAEQVQPAQSENGSLPPLYPK
ncbi:BatD family protein [Pseudomonas rubra]|uniref:BatD family protein n=1 Tax=Pseudomonas rubra TaxID=2942627 RepID=A0ABT5PCR6_9PSED|nr:BatD family protein [Pseudomonas rubra]MDD1016043.1 BatD family protein [Pseudomonas rubra]MDD1039186.1 BatD family protein [Pseudomonas rubra]MDD1155156.1 BatD family protein [Pseudomonas rubra]